MSLSLAYWYFPLFAFASNLFVLPGGTACAYLHKIKIASLHKFNILGKQ